MGTRMAVRLMLVVVLALAGGSASAAEAAGPPTVSGFSPGFGLPGTVVTISGSGFTNALTVTFGWARATVFSVDSDSQITATVPKNGNTGLVRVRTRAGTGVSSGFFHVLVGGPGWYQFGHDAAHTGVDPKETALSPETVGTLQLDWTAAGTGPPSIAGGILYAGSAALDAATGARLWSAPVPGSDLQSAVANGLVYIGSGDGNLYACDALSGAVRWSAPSGASGQAAPVVAGGAVFVSGNGRITAFDAATGAVRWVATPGGGAPLTSPAVANGLVYAVAKDNQLYALDATTGAIVWVNVSAGPVEAAPVVAGGTVYAGSTDSRYGVHAFDARRGTVRWLSTGISSHYSPAVANGIVYVGADSGELDALDARTGTLRWSFGVGPTYVPGGSTPAVANGVVYVAGAGGVYALDATTGTELTIIRGSYFSPPVVANGVLYVGAGRWPQLRAFHLPPVGRPTVTGFSPDWGYPGTTVTISGTGLDGTTSVSFGGVEASSFTVDSDTQITATVPDGTGTGSIAVTAPRGRSTSRATFDVPVHGLDWPQFGFDSGYSGFNPNETVLGPGNVASLQQVWLTQQAGGNGAAVADGVVYAGGPFRVSALDEATGTKLWRAGTAGHVIGSPAVADGLVYVGTGASWVEAFDAVTGALRWSYWGGSNFPTSTPRVADGFVYVCTTREWPWPARSGLDAFDAKTGTLIWSVLNVGDPSVANGLVYTNTPAGLEALDAATGALVWQDTLPPGYVPVVVGDSVYIRALTGTFYVLDALSGAVRWSWTNPPFDWGGSIAVAHGNVYADAYNGNVYAFDAASGILLWETHLLGADQLDTPVVANGVVYVQSASGPPVLYMLDADTGAILSRLPVGTGSYNEPVVVDGSLYVDAYPGFRAFRVPPGALAHR
jgi:outer membrane protein assembly factor BamB